MRKSMRGNHSGTKQVLRFRKTTGIKRRERASTKMKIDWRGRRESGTGRSIGDSIKLAACDSRRGRRVVALTVRVG